MKDLIVLAAVGSEGRELITIVDVLSRHNVSYDLMSVESKNSVDEQN